MLDHFATDLDKLTQYGANLKDGALGKALIDVAIADYYFMQSGFTKDFFNAIGGGIGFDLADIGTGGIRNKTAIQLDNAITQQLNLGLETRRFLGQDNYWSIQSGNTALNAAGTSNNNDAMIGGATGDALDGGAGSDFLYGGDGADNLTGGANDDLLIGGDGTDTMTGGTGDDLLSGGASYDTYIYASGDGWDWIDDSDGQGQILYDGAALTGGRRIADNVWQSADEKYTYSLIDHAENGITDKALYIDGPTGGMLVKHWRNTQLGITLDDTPLSPAADIVGTTANDRLLGTAANQTLNGLGGHDILIGGDGAQTLGGDSGSDFLQGGGGKDILSGGLGDDVLDGGTGSDVLNGDDGNDILFAGGGLDASISIWSSPDFTGFVTNNGGQPTLANAIAGNLIIADAADNILSGGTGNDTLIGGEGDDLADGGADTDVLLGASGNDYLIGAAGNDTLYGDGTQGSTVNFQYNDLSHPDVEVAIQPQYHGDDTLEGGDGNDYLQGDGGSDELYGGAGDDNLAGDATGLDGQYQGNDYLDGGVGNDTLFGNGGSDTLFGGAGADMLQGDSADTPPANLGNDYLDGEDGNDTLLGGGGDDILFGGAGDDMLQGDSADTPLANLGNDYLDGEDGNDTLLGGGGNDTLIGGTGSDLLDGGDGSDVLMAGADNDELQGGAGNDSLNGDAGDDTLFGQAGDDGLDGGDGNDTLSGEAGNDVLSGGAGSDLLDGGDGNNALTGGDGNDQLQSGSGNDNLSGDAGDDILIAQAGDDTLSGGDGNDNLDGGDGNDVIMGDASSDTLFGGNGGDRLYGGDGTDILMGEAGDDQLDGGAGDDVLNGDTGNDTLAGGGGNDMLYGGDGSDTYVYNPGDGVVHIGDNNANGQINTLSLGAGIDPAQITLGLGSLMLDLGNGDAIHLDGFNPDDAVNSSGIQRFTFADGTVLSAAGMLAKGFDFGGTNGNDDIHGTSVADQITGGAGDDTLGGGLGNDTYYYQRGDGADKIVDQWQWAMSDGSVVGDTNTLVLGAGITSAPASITPHLDNLTRQVTLDFGNGDAINIGVVDNVAIQWLKFADGTTQPIAEFFGQSQFDIAGTGAAEHLVGTPFNDRIEGKAGNDTLEGNSGSDIYVYNLGDGAEVIHDSGRYFGAPGADGNTLKFGPGITPDMIQVRHVGDSCVLDLGNGGSIDVGMDSFRDLILHGFDPNANPFKYFAVQTLAFDSGATLDIQDFVMQHGLAKTGTAAGEILTGDDLYHALIADRLQGGAGADTLKGGAGSDIYVFNRGDGADVIMDSAYGSVQDPKWLEWMENGPNTLSFGAGITANDIISRIDPISGHVVLDLGGGGSVDIGQQYDLAVQTLRFPDGSEIGIDAFLSSRITETTGTADADSVSGMGDYPNHMQGFGGDDYLGGGTNVDVLDGGTGNDILSGWRGNDTYLYRRGDGADSVIDSGWRRGRDLSGQPVDLAEINTLAFTAGIGVNDITPLWDGNTLTLNLGNGDSIAVGALADIAIQVLGFADGTSLSMKDFLALKGVVQLVGTQGADLMAMFGGIQPLQGLGGNDRLFGSVLDDTLEGGAGNDTLAGAEGNDTYAYKLGDGADTIVDPVNSGSAESNTLSFGAGITADMIAPVYDEAKQTLTLDLGIGDSIDIGSLSSPAVQNLRFSDGTQLSLDRWLVQSGGIPRIGTAAGDWMNGSQFADRLEGLAGNDSMNGHNGNDILVGGKGNDYLAGSNGDDTYIFNRGDGNDVIDDLPWGFGGNGGEVQVDNSNTLILRGGITAAMLQLVFGSTDDVTLDLGNGDSVNIGNLDRLAIQQIEFSDGAVFSSADILSGELIASPLADVTTLQDAAFSYTLPAYAFVEAGNDTLTYAANVANGDPLPAWLSFDTASKSFSGMPGNGDVGAIQVKVTASDLAGASVEAVFAISVANVNDAPVATGEHAAINEDTVLSYTQSALLANDVDIDPTHDVLRIATVGNALHGQVAMDASGIVLFTPDANFNGAAGFDYTVIDGQGGSANASVVIDVLPVNDAPVALLPLADQTTKESTPFVFSVPANTFGDVDIGDVPTYSAAQADGSALPAWLNFDAATQRFSGTPAHGDIGNLSIKVTATDHAGATTSEIFALAIQSGNAPPITVPDKASVSEDGILSAKGNVLANDSDPDTGAVLQVADSGIRQGTFGKLTLTSDGGYLYTLNNSSNAVQSLGAGQTAVDRFTYQASDGKATTLGELLVTVSGKNDIPVLATSLHDRKLTTNTDVIWQVPAKSFIDVDQGDVLTYSATLINGAALPKWLVFDSAARTFRGLVPNDEPRTLKIKVTASDGHGTKSVASDTFSVSFSKGNDHSDDEGVGDGEDDRSPDHDTDQDDDAGTSPGNPDSSDGKGTGNAVHVIADANYNQIWLRHTGNDLELSVIGTTEKLTMENWYDSSLHSDLFETADNKVLSSTQVERLVQAMASFDPPPAGQMMLPNHYQEALTPVIAANWH